MRIRHGPASFSNKDIATQNKFLSEGLLVTSYRPTFLSSLENSSPILGNRFELHKTGVARKWDWKFVQNVLGLPEPSWDMTRTLNNWVVRQIPVARGICGCGWYSISRRRMAYARSTISTQGEASRRQRHN